MALIILAVIQCWYCCLHNIHFYSHKRVINVWFCPTSVLIKYLPVWYVSLPHKHRIVNNSYSHLVWLSRACAIQYICLCTRLMVPWYYDEYWRQEYHYYTERLWLIISSDCWRIFKYLNKLQWHWVVESYFRNFRHYQWYFRPYDRVELDTCLLD